MQAMSSCSHSLKDLRATGFYINRVLKNNPEHPLVETIAKKSDVLAESLMHSSNDAAKIAKSDFLVQKYQSNLILLLTTKCPQRCAECFRKTSNGSDTPKEEIAGVLDAARNSSALVEIILSGGEPLSVNPETLRMIAAKAEEINRGRDVPLLVTVHSRLPVVDPHAIANGRLEALAKLAPQNLDIHILHPDEITKEFVALCRRLSRVIPGISLRSIHPMLKGINDSAETLKNLYTRLVAEAGVVPRDLIMPMPGPTPEKLMVTLEHGMKVARELAIAVPGHLLPRLVVCSPVSGKSYPDPFHMKKDGSFGFDTTPDGRLEGMFIKDGSCLQHACAVKLEAAGRQDAA